MISNVQLSVCHIYELFTPIMNSIFTEYIYNVIKVFVQNFKYTKKCFRYRALQNNVNSYLRWSNGRPSMASKRSPACNVPVRWAIDPLRISEIKKGSSGWCFEAEKKHFILQLTKTSWKKIVRPQRRNLCWEWRKSRQFWRPLKKCLLNAYKTAESSDKSANHRGFVIKYPLTGG